MPTIARANVAAATANALDGLKFQDIQSPGALITLYASGPTAGGTIDYSVGTEDFLDGGAFNIEASADVVDTDRDKLLDREPVPVGKQFLAVNLQIANFVLIIEDLPG